MAALSKAMASSKFDFPDPLGPMSTFSGSMGRSTPSGPNDSMPDTFSLRSMRAPVLSAAEGGDGKPSRAQNASGFAGESHVVACQAMFEHGAIVYAIAPCIVRLAGAISQFA